MCVCITHLSWQALPGGRTSNISCRPSSAQNIYIYRLWHRPSNYLTQLDRIGICICGLCGKESVCGRCFMCYNWVKRCDPGVGASFSLVQRCRNGSCRRIPGRRGQGILQVQQVGMRQQRYLRPSRYGYKNGSDTCTNRSDL